MNKLAMALLLCLISATGFAAQDGHASGKRNYAEMLARGEVRMAVPYDRTLYVDGKSQKLGASPFIEIYLGKFLTAKYKKNIRITLVPTVQGQLVNAIDSGQADFAHGFIDEYGSTIDNSKYIVFPRLRHERHVLVSNISEAPISSLIDVSGATVCLGRQTEAPIFNELNNTLQKSGKKPIHVYKDRLVLDDEDLLQMLNDGLVPHVYVALWKANLWKPLLKNVRINDETISPGNATEGVIVGSLNKSLSDDILEFVDSPFLEAALNNFRTSDFKYREHALKNPTEPREWARYVAMKPIFEQYAPESRLDPLFLAALGFQETMLNQSLVSPMGAIGVMQLLPATGASMKAGDIHQLEPNIHAGAKYMSSLLYSMSINDEFTVMERAFFATAAYNAGPNNIRKARDQAAKAGFNPNKWFLNVEMVAAQMMGLETFFYVRNVYKYFVAYDVRQRKLDLDQAEKIRVESK
ncbi:MAG: hypothetical protein FGM53_07045 [Rhodocyclaceae bacterium]|nr:hypothetical protein [Rhodocyclaceae bacterium]